MRRPSWHAVAIAGIIFCTSSREAAAETLDIAPGRLGETIVALGIQTRTTIILADASLAERRSPGVRGDHALRAALRRVLRGTGTEPVFLTSGVVQIRARKTNPPPPSPAPPKSPEALPPAIIVTATKQDVPLHLYPGSVKIVEPDRGWSNRHGAEGTSALTRLMPALTSTNLGNGRNKMFIRGMADSSFSGPTQTTTGQFLGDVRLTYNAPDPDLALYDMKRFEVLTGPQGTLYGAGSLGGIIRLVPNPPEMDDFAAAMTGGIGLTRHGGISADGAVSINVPLVRGRVATRLLVYGGREGGYIDAPLQGRRNINHTVRYGERLSVRAEDIGGWTIDAGSVVQNISTGDGQYVLRGQPAFTREGTIPQPFENNYRLGHVSVQRSFEHVTLTSVTSLARHDQSSVFDATGIDGTTMPLRYTEANDIVLFFHETRIAGRSRRHPWTAGFSLTRSASEFTVSLGPPDQVVERGGRDDVRTEFALFGEVSRPLSSTVTATVGGRLTYSLVSQRLINIPMIENDRPPRRELRFSRTIGLNWNPTASLTAFYHNQQGHRPGGLGVTLTEEGLDIRRFASDDLDVHEIGVRWGGRSTPLSGQVALFRADWRNIQADLIGEYGLPLTTNIGSGLIDGVDVELKWRASPTLSFSASAILNDSRLGDAARQEPNDGASAAGRGRPLPNVARNGGRVGAIWQRTLASGARLSVEGATRYVGRSYLGLAPLLDIPQGDYVVADVGARFERPRFAISLDVLNATGSRGNTFSYGNPFGVSRRDQVTYLRPRTVKMQFEMRL